MLQVQLMLFEPQWLHLALFDTFLTKARCINVNSPCQETSLLSHPRWSENYSINLWGLVWPTKGGDLVFPDLELQLLGRFAWFHPQTHVILSQSHHFTPPSHTILSEWYSHLLLKLWWCFPFSYLPLAWLLLLLPNSLLPPAMCYFSFHSHVLLAKKVFLHKCPSLSS